MAGPSFPFLEEERPIYLAEQLAIAQQLSVGFSNTRDRHRAREIITRLQEEEAMLADLKSAELQVETQARLSAAIIEGEVGAVELIAAGYRPAGTEGKEAMASADTIQQITASGGFTVPEGLKSMLPLLLIVGVVLIILFKK